VASATYRAYFFPYAGVGPSVYRPWLDALPSALEARLIQLPAREARWREPAMTRIADIAPAVASAIAGELDAPFVFYGHSLGALAAFEVTRQLRAMGAPLPAHLFLGAHRAPHLPNPHPEIRHLADDAFVTELRRRYDGIPEAVLANPELLELMLPALRADFNAYETYSHASQPAIGVPISAFAGETDLYVRPSEVAEWQQQTEGAFRMRVIPGGHFFLQSERDRVLAAVREDLGL
jgi:surfactin synthase thioesterase subunit